MERKCGEDKKVWIQLKMIYDVLSWAVRPVLGGNQSQPLAQRRYVQVLVNLTNTEYSWIFVFKWLQKFKLLELIFTDNYVNCEMQKI